MSVNNGSFTPTEFLVIGGNQEQKIRALSKMIQAEIYVPETIQGTSGENVVFLQSLSTTYQSPRNNIELIQKEKCGLREKFSN